MYCNNKCFVSIYFTAYNKMNSKVLLPGTPTSKIKVRAVQVRPITMFVDWSIQWYTLMYMYWRMLTVSECPDRNHEDTSE